MLINFLNLPTIYLISPYFPYVSLDFIPAQRLTKSKTNDIFAPAPYKKIIANQIAILGESLSLTVILMERVSATEESLANQTDSSPVRSRIFNFDQSDIFHRHTFSTSPQFEALDKIRFKSSCCRRLPGYMRR